MKKRAIDRRSFLKGFGLTTTAVAAAAVVPRLPPLERLPKEGERFRLWAASETMDCLNCGRGVLVDSDVYAIYSGQEEQDGETFHVFLVENPVRCPRCLNRATTLKCPDVKFIESEQANERKGNADNG